MTATTAAPPRIQSLDIVRGFAVLGILAMNIAGYALPLAAYANPYAYGDSGATDLVAYTVNFIFFDGKMRGLFAMLFGASMLLIIGRAEAAGRRPLRTVMTRQFWLLVFGIIHFYLIWTGDILISLAIVGMGAWFFRDKGPIELAAIGATMLVVDLFITGQTAASAHMLEQEARNPFADAATHDRWQSLKDIFGMPSRETIEASLELHRGPWAGVVANQIGEHLEYPFRAIIDNGWETLGYMLIGMAALKSGFLSGDWDRAAYRKIAIVAFAIAIAGYAILAVLLFLDGFTAPGVLTYVHSASIPFRAVMTIGYAALIIAAFRSGGWIAGRVAAVGRAAFTNYLGTSILMTGIFYGWGLGLYGHVGRAGLWAFVLIGWAAMLAWSRPWLDRYRYGPLEWLWRSLSRGRPQPMRRA